MRDSNTKPQTQRQASKPNHALQPKITPFLWFDNQAEQAANLYVSIFKNSKVVNTSRYGEAGPGPKGSVMVVTFQLNGQEFTALNGGPCSNSRRPSRLS